MILPMRSIDALAPVSCRDCAFFNKVLKAHEVNLGLARSVSVMPDSGFFAMRSTVSYAKCSRRWCKGYSESLCASVVETVVDA